MKLKRNSLMALLLVVTIVLAGCIPGGGRAKPDPDLQLVDKLIGYMRTGNLDELYALYEDYD